MAIMGTWASSVTTAVAPLCWESKTFLCTVSGADSITLLPHQGFLIPHQPNSKLQVTRVGEFILSLGAKKVFTMIPQTPFTQSTFDILNQVPAQGRRHPPEPDLRRQEDDLSHRGRPGAACSPDVILANANARIRPSCSKTSIAAGFKGKILGFAYSIQPEAFGPDRPARGGRGRLHLRTLAGRGQRAYERVKAAVGSANPNPIPARSTITSTWS